MTAKLIEKRSPVFGTQLESSLKRFLSPSSIEFINNEDIMDYPINMGLPGEADILRIVNENKFETVDALFNKFPKKLGLEKWIASVVARKCLIENGVLCSKL